MYRNNIGAFEILSKLVEENPEFVAAILKELQFVPVRVECIWYKSKFEYVGLSPKFKRLNEGEKHPQYKIKITEGESGITAVEAIPEDSVKLVSGIDQATDRFEVEVDSWAEDSAT